MTAIGRYLYQVVSSAFLMDDADPFVLYGSDRYQPSVNDVISVKEALYKRSKLPFELIDIIIDLAEYWPHTTTITTASTTVRWGHEHENQFILRSYPLGFIPDPKNQGDEFGMDPGHHSKYETEKPVPWPEAHEVPENATDLVITHWVSKSLPRGEYPCRKIIFTIKSHDQGWAGRPSQHGTYAGSYTWFDVGLEKMSAYRVGESLQEPVLAPWPQFRLNKSEQQHPVPDPIVCSLRTIIPQSISSDAGSNSHNHHTFSHPLNPSEMALQRNITARKATKEHKIIWSCADSIIPSSAEGDTLHLQGRGRDTGLGNFVREMKVGDVVTVWAKVRFRGWINSVEEVKMDLYWAV